MNTAIQTKTKTERFEPRTLETRVTPKVRTGSDRFVLANRDWYPGLCATCVNDAVCTFPRSMQRPVVSCDEFEGIVTQKVSHRSPSPGEAERFVAANREWYPGLCMTCNKQESCTYPRPEGGVFNCDEFE
jgi:hypothetical protein